MGPIEQGRTKAESDKLMPFKEPLISKGREVLRKASASWMVAGLPRHPSPGSSCEGGAPLTRCPWAEVCSGQVLAKLSEALNLPPSGPRVLQAQLGPTAFMPDLYRLPPQWRFHHHLRCEQRVSSQCAGTSLSPSGWSNPHHGGVRADAGGTTAASSAIALNP